MRRNQSAEQEFSHGGTGLADQFPFVCGVQFLDRRLHPAGFRLVQAGELDEQPTRGIGLCVTRTISGDVLCVARSHIAGDAGVDRSVAAEDEVYIPTFCRACLGRPRAVR